MPRGAREPPPAPRARAAAAQRPPLARRPPRMLLLRSFSSRAAATNSITESPCCTQNSLISRCRPLGMRVASWMRTSSSLAMDPDLLGRALGRDEELFNLEGGLPQTGGAGALGAGRRAAGPPLEVPLDGLELSRQVADVELRAHAGEELDPVDRLGQELAHAVVHALEARVHVVARRQQDDGEALARLAQ